MQMRQVIKACRHCLQYEGGTPKAPLWPIVDTTPLDLLHIDFMSIETMMELDKSPRVTNVLVFQDHFTKHVLAYVTPNQTAKTIAKFLYGGYISIFGALARILSDRGTSFTSSIIQELCKILGINDCRPCPTTPTLMGWYWDHTRQLCAWLGSWVKTKKPTAITFGWNSACLQCHPICSYWVQFTLFDVWMTALAPSWLCLPHRWQQWGPTREASARKVDTYIASVRDSLRSALQEAQAQLPQKHTNRNGTMTEK